MEPTPKFEAPPQFVAPADPMPRFKQPKTAARDYAAALAAVEAGQSITLSVGITPQPMDYYEAAHAMIQPGRYQCWRDETGVARMAPLLPPKQQPLLMIQRK